jgi:hypothetical protein
MIRWLLLSLPLVLFPTPAAADPCTGSGDGDFDNPLGSAPSPAAASAIRMLAETVDFIEASDGGSWAVKAHYVFGNTRDRPVRASLIFPFTAPSRACEMAVQYEYSRTEEDIAREEVASNHFTVRIDGAAVPATFRAKGVTCSGGLEYPFGYFFVHEFAPQRNAVVDVEYDVASGPAWSTPGELDCPCYGPGFILRTGALWEGPIGEIVLRYHLARPTAFFEVADGSTVLAEPGDECRISRFDQAKVTAASVEFQTAVACSGNEELVTLTARDVEPTGDISFAVHSIARRDKVLELQGCPFDATTKQPARDCCPLLTSPVSTKLPAQDSREADEDPLRTYWKCFTGLESLAGQSLITASSDAGSSTGTERPRGSEAGERDADVASASAPDAGQRTPDAGRARPAADASPAPVAAPSATSPAAPPPGASACDCTAAAPHGRSAGLQRLLALLSP